MPGDSVNAVGVDSGQRLRVGSDLGLAKIHHVDFVIAVAVALEREL